MDDKQFEQQMKLLKKTYERVPSKFNADEVLRKIEEEGNQTKEPILTVKSPTSKWQKISVWAVSLASVFIIGILSASFLNDGKEQGDKSVTEFDENDIEKLEKAYQEEREKRRKMLDLTDEQFDSLGFVQFADQEFTRTIKPGSLESNQSGMPLELRYSKVIDFLKLPSEMVQNALESKEKFNEEQSMQYIDELTTKIDHLTYVYDLVINEHLDVMNTAKMNGELDADYLYGHRAELPEPVENMLVNAPKQGISIAVSPDKNRFIAKFQIEYEMRDVLSETAYNYLEIKSNLPFLWAGKLSYEPAQAAHLLQFIEKTLLETKIQNTAIQAVTKMNYLNLAEMLIYDNESNNIFENGKLKNEYSMAWDTLRSTMGVSPIKFFIEPFYQSMVMNEWRINETYKTLDMSDLSYAFSLAEVGDLAELMPGEEFTFQSESYNIPDTDLTQKVHGYFKTVGASSDLQELEFATPIEIVALAQFAREFEKSSLEYSLYRVSDQLPNFEDYNLIMQDQNIIPEDSTNLQYVEERTYLQEGEYHTTVEIFKDGNPVKTIQLIRQKGGLWQIVYEAPLVPPGYYYEPKVAQTDVMEDSVVYLYKKYKQNHNFSLLKSASAIEVAGMYLEADKQGDLETQYELLLKDDQYVTPSREEFLSYPTDGGHDWKVQFEAFEIIQNTPTDANGEFDVVVWFDLNYSLVTDDDSRRGFQMRKTADGWRVHFMPMQ
ncbi:hypothetical protein [Paenisporosarcina indica]|uniref:hypothetical protein n=1 Tax=Paenisporosarcina indica TaxID=650093 RepID=UPI00094F5C02|nr:hypothetical protein [Paenisporosarcina indica]